MHEKLKRKLRSRAGESIAEVLVALLIAALAMATLAGMIGATYSMVEKSKTTMKSYVDANNGLVTQDSGGTDGKATLSITVGEGSTQTSTPVKISEGDADDKTISVVYFSNSQISGKTVISYEKGSTT